MITAAQLRAARLLLGIDQRRLAELSGLSVPTIQRMEASETMVRGNVDSLVKLIAAFNTAGIEMIDEGAVSSSQGRGVRLKMNSSPAKDHLERFRAKWIPVRGKKTRQNKRFEPGSDSIRTDKALDHQTEPKASGGTRGRA
jgi:transcriptional regulator with XRE-family HTH domain